MGVEMVDSSSKQKATKNNIDRGVAGRSMVGYRCAGCAGSRRARDRLEGGSGERLSWALRSSLQAGLGELRGRGGAASLVVWTGPTRGVAA